MATETSDRVLQGQVAFVSGGGTGIGRAIALALAGAGASVAVSGRRNHVLAETVDAITADGGRALALSSDVSDPRDCLNAVARTRDELGALSILVNNAGVATPGALAETLPQDVHAMIDTDLKGPIFLSQAALPQLKAARSNASILNISSSVTLQAIESYSVYSAAKAGIDMLTRCWARELAADGVRVNAICPGIVDTPVFETMMPADQIEGFLDHFGETVPLGRVGQPQDIARLALFLSSPQSAWTTGAVIPVDGGLSLVS
jgi:NAD(P)-dependent dehydrogenase (short-subunit alcohol dehydrogenase family)